MRVLARLISMSGSVATLAITSIRDIARFLEVLIGTVRAAVVKGVCAT